MNKDKETLLHLKMRYTLLARLVGMIGLLIFVLLRALIFTILEYFQ